MNVIIDESAKKSLRKLDELPVRSFFMKNHTIPLYVMKKPPDTWPSDSETADAGEPDHPHYSRLFYHRPRAFMLVVKGFFELNDLTFPPR